MAANAAIVTLEERVAELKDGINSIASQKEHLEGLKSQVKRAERRLAEDKRALLETEGALELLKAGEED